MAFQLHVLLSYRTLKTGLKPSVEIVQGDNVLRNMTNIFRMNFWSVFDRVLSFDFHQRKVNYLAYSGQIQLSHTIS